MPKIYRRRYIPEETIHLAEDEILLNQPNLLITRWKSLKPRSDFATGTSAYYIDRNFKISKFFDAEGRLCYYYCDIIKTISEEGGNTLIFCDLLVDLMIFPDYTMRVLDLHELREAHEAGRIEMSDVFLAIDSLDSLLQAVYSGEFAELVKVLE